MPMAKRRSNSLAPRVHASGFSMMATGPNIRAHDISIILDSGKRCACMCGTNVPSVPCADLQHVSPDSFSILHLRYATSRIELNACHIARRIRSEEGNRCNFRHMIDKPAGAR
jgi:hypothetical protein